MDGVKLFGFAMAALVMLSILRTYSPAHAVAASLACSVVLLWAAVSALEPVVQLLDTLSQLSDMEHLRSVFKAVAITLLAQCAQDLCREAGQTALAGRVELVGKVAVLAAALPLFSALVQILTELLQ
jgi:stage III sporulation protein AD